VLILPLYTELRLNKQPYITYAIIILCLFIYYAQVQNREQIDKQVNQYCGSIYSPASKNNRLEILKTNINTCAELLWFLHERSEHGGFDFIRTELEAGEYGGYSTNDIEKILALINRHLQREISGHIFILR